MKTKNEIAIKLTDKNRKKVKDILEMFGEKYTGANGFEYTSFDARFNNWCGYAVLKQFDGGELTLVKPKELKQILAREKLKVGDYVVLKPWGLKGKIVSLDCNYEFNISDEVGDITTCVIWDFKRYATPEEITTLEAKPLEKLEKVKWYKHENGAVHYDHYGINQDGVWYENSRMLPQYIKHWTEATPDEVLTALTKAAKKKGFVEGATIGNPSNSFTETIISEMGDLRFDGAWLYYAWDDDEGHKRWDILQDGKWATVVDKFVGVKETEVPTKWFLDISDCNALEQSVINSYLKTLDEFKEGFLLPNNNGLGQLLLSEDREGDNSYQKWGGLGEGRLKSEGFEKIDYKFFETYIFKDTKPESVKLVDSDIAVIEQLHDLLVEEFGFHVYSNKLVAARDLCEKIKTIIKNNNND